MNFMGRKRIEKFGIQRELNVKQTALLASVGIVSACETLCLNRFSFWLHSEKARNSKQRIR